MVNIIIIGALCSFCKIHLNKEVSDVGCKLGYHATGLHKKELDF
jgi:hypothetical protein